MEEILTCSDCVPAVNSKTGQFMKRNGGRKARQILEQREGPPPFPKALCRHLCENDSQAPNGFVCTLHTIWGTQSENMMDRSPENRAKGPRIAGRIGGKIVANKPDNPNKVQVTCPHCGKVGAKLIMARWHFDNCKLSLRFRDAFL